MNKYQIADTLINQIGNKAFYMMGSKTLVRLENGIRFKIGKNSLANNLWITITLNSMDLYDGNFCIY